MANQADQDSRSTADPRLLAYLPMVYVAWADGDLSDEEIRSICSKMSKAMGADTSCRDLLDHWLDPDRPPSAADLQGLLSVIRRSAEHLSTADKRSLSELGLELVRASGKTVSPAEQKALEEIEVVLGLTGPELARRLLTPVRPAAVPEAPTPAFDVDALARLLDGEQQSVRQRVKEILSGPEFRHQYGLDTTTYREQVLSWCQTLAAEGLGSLSYPRYLGGSDDPAAFVATFETLGFHDISLLTKFGVQFGLFGGSILQLGTRGHHGRYIEAIGRLELPGGFAMTETGHGSNVQDLETVARYDPNGEVFVIHTPNDGARKDYIGNAALHGRMVTVFAQLETDGHSHGVHAFLVPIRNDDGNLCPGIRVEDCGEKLGLNGVDNGRIWFDQVRIPRENLLDRFASVAPDGRYSSPIASPSRRFFTMLGTLVGGRVSVSLAALSAAKSALTIAVRYAAKRRQFGPEGEAETVLLDYLSHQRRLLPRLATTYALHFALRNLASRHLQSTDQDRREVEALAAGLKAISAWNATDSIQACREACGGQGYLAINRFAALKADSDVFNTYEGDNTVLLQLVAKGLLSGYRQQFGEMNFWGIARYLASQTAAVVTELNPVITRKTDEEHLRDRDFHLGAFRWREEHLIGSVAGSIKKRIDSGMDSFDALNQVQDHALAAARAHVERLVLERFAAAISECQDPDLVNVLDTLCDLFALHTMESDRGWFLEHSYLEPPKAKAIRKLINKILGEVRQQAVPLVDAFDIPDELLAAPIAL